MIPRCLSVLHAARVLSPPHQREKSLLKSPKSLRAWLRTTTLIVYLVPDPPPHSRPPVLPGIWHQKNSMSLAASLLRLVRIFFHAFFLVFFEPLRTEPEHSKNVNLRYRMCYICISEWDSLYSRILVKGYSIHSNVGTSNVYVETFFTNVCVLTVLNVLAHIRL